MEDEDVIEGDDDLIKSDIRSDSSELESIAPVILTDEQLVPPPVKVKKRATISVPEAQLQEITDNRKVDDPLTGTTEPTAGAGKPTDDGSDGIDSPQGAAITAAEPEADDQNNPDNVAANATSERPDDDPDAAAMEKPQDDHEKNPKGLTGEGEVGATGVEPDKDDIHQDPISDGDPADTDESRDKVHGSDLPNVEGIDHEQADLFAEMDPELSGENTWGLDDLGKTLEGAIEAGLKALESEEQGSEAPGSGTPGSGLPTSGTPSSPDDKEATDAAQVGLPGGSKSGDEDDGDDMKRNARKAEPEGKGLPSGDLGSSDKIKLDGQSNEDGTSKQSPERASGTSPLAESHNLSSGTDENNQESQLEFKLPEVENAAQLAAGHGGLLDDTSPPPANGNNPPAQPGAGVDLMRDSAQQPGPHQLNQPEKALGGKSGRPGDSLPMDNLSGDDGKNRGAAGKVQDNWTDFDDDPFDALTGQHDLHKVHREADASRQPGLEPVHGVNAERQKNEESGYNQGGGDAARLPPNQFPTGADGQQGNNGLDPRWSVGPSGGQPADVAGGTSSQGPGPRRDGVNPFGTGQPSELGPDGRRNVVGGDQPVVGKQPMGRGAAVPSPHGVPSKQLDEHEEQSGDELGAVPVVVVQPHRGGFRSETAPGGEGAGVYDTDPSDSESAALIPKHGGHRGWTTGLCECGDTCGQVVYTDLCLTCSIYNLAKRMGQTDAGGCLCCLKCYLADLRTRLRDSFDIPGNEDNDCCVSFLCPSCAIVQMERELTARGRP